MNRNTADLNRAVTFIRNWECQHEHPEWKSALDEANWYIAKLTGMVERINGEREAFHKLLDCDIRIANRPKGLPDLHRVYMLVKNSSFIRAAKYSKIRRKYVNVVKLFEGINHIDGHFFEALDPSKAKKDRKYRYEAEIETTGKWYIPPTETVESIRSIFHKTGDRDLQEYAIKCVENHKVCPEEVNFKNLAFFRGLVYFGKSKHGRPLFALVELHAEHGKSIEFPKEWRIVYMREWRKNKTVITGNVFVEQHDSGRR